MAPMTLGRAGDWWHESGPVASGIVNFGCPQPGPFDGQRRWLEILHERQAEDERTLQLRYTWSFAMPFAPRLVEWTEPTPVPALRTLSATLAAMRTRAGLPVRDLATMLEDKKLDKQLRVAAALAWGEVAPTNAGAAANALDRMLKARYITESDRRPAAAEDDERRRYYRLSSFGRGVLQAEAARLARAVSHARSKKIFAPA